MGATYVTATVRNPGDPERAWEGEFLVDTGAVECVVPKQHLEAIGLVPKGERTYTLADGSEVTLAHTTGDIEFMDDVVGVTIIMAEDANSFPLLGLTALESAHIEIDPRNQQLRRLPAIRL